MIKTMTRAGLALAPLAVAGVAHAQVPPPAPAAPVAKTYSSYVSISGGSYNELDFDYEAFGLPVNTTASAGLGVEAAWGSRLSNGLRAEFGFSWQDHPDTETVRQSNGAFVGTGTGVSIFTFDANGYIDFAPSQPINFYVGAGIGIVGFHIDDGLIAESVVNGPVAQGIAGVEFKASETMRIYVEGRYRQMWMSNEDDFGNTVEINTNTINGSAGLRFLF